MPSTTWLKFFELDPIIEPIAADVVPVVQAHMVTRYVGVGGKAPALSKLGGASWQKTRKSAEKSVEEFAAKMLRHIGFNEF